MRLLAFAFTIVFVWTGPQSLNLVRVLIRASSTRAIMEAFVSRGIGD